MPRHAGRTKLVFTQMYRVEASHATTKVLFCSLRFVLFFSLEKYQNATPLHATRPQHRDAARGIFGKWLSRFDRHFALLISCMITHTHALAEPFAVRTARANTSSHFQIFPARPHARRAHSVTFGRPGTHTREALHYCLVKIRSQRGGGGEGRRGAPRGRQRRLRRRRRCHGERGPSLELFPVGCPSLKLLSHSRASRPQCIHRGSLSGSNTYACRLGATYESRRANTKKS